MRRIEAAVSTESVRAVFGDFPDAREAAASSILECDCRACEERLYEWPCIECGNPVTGRRAEVAGPYERMGGQCFRCFTCLPDESEESEEGDY